MRVLLLLLLLLMTALAASRMNASLWYDEYRSLFNVGAGFMGPSSPGQILTRIATENAWQAPAYYLILAGWGAMAGWSEFATRALSLFFGLLAVCWLYRFGRAAFNPRVGLAAAVALGLSAFYVHFLHEMRAYTLVSLLTVILLDSYWRLVYRGGGRATAALFTLAVAGLPYTHYFAVAAPLALAVYHLLFAPKNRRWLLVSGLMALALLLFLPWLWVALRAVQMAGADTRRFQVLAPGELLTRIMILFGSNSPALVALLLAFAVLARRRAALLAWFMLVGGFVLMVGLDQFVHILVEVKYAMPLFPILALVAALGIDQLARRGVPSWLLLGLWLAGGLWSVHNPAFEEMITPDVWRFPWRQAVAGIAPRGQPDDRVLVLLPDPSLLEKNYQPLMDYYFHGLPVEPRLVAPSPQTTDERYFTLATDGADDAERVWVLYDRTRRPWRDGLLESTVLPGVGYAACGRVDAVEPIGLSLFMRAPDADETPAARYEGIAVYDGGFPARTNGPVLPVTLGFASTIPPDAYSFGLHVVDAGGNLVAQQDEGLPAGPFACRALDVPTVALAPGTYTLRLVVYLWQTGERLTDAAGEDRPTLGTFEYVGSTAGG